MDISKIDSNFKVKTNIVRDSLRFRDVEEEPFRIYGLLRENDRFCRMPGNIAKGINDGVSVLYTNTAGGRVRFVTDSMYIAIVAEMDGIAGMPHMALSGNAGFDLYANNGQGQMYVGTYIPPYGMMEGYEGVIDFNKKEERIITINFPLYSNVKKLYIGLSVDSVIKRAPDYKYEKPIVYYGSSITQGGCASRPGNSYQAIISRKLDINYINLGFSGSAMGEDAMTDYINTLAMSMFVMDYDHNAPTVEHLHATHERMYRKIRDCHPNLPIVMMSRPKFHLSQDEEERLEIVEQTYKNALKTGDQNVHLITGPELIQEDMIETATVDNCHPNDSGFVSMANGLYQKIIQFL